MFISNITYCNLRNLLDFRVFFSSRFNIIAGLNGSGKTSFLEAIYLLAGGQSFRTHLVRNIVKHGQNCTTVFARINKNGQEIDIGVKRCLQGKSERKLNHNSVTNAAELASVIPVQIIGYDRFSLLNGGPRYKREFLDWGLFHSEPNFFQIWKKFNHCLKQRNASLRQSASEDEVTVWNKSLIEFSTYLDDYRRTYLSRLIPHIREVLAGLSVNSPFEVNYYPGWDEKYPYGAALCNGFARDRQVGYTTQGPHRCDVHWMTNNKYVHEVLSRGQQKILLFAISLAQNQVLFHDTGKSGILLIDDIAAELDRDGQRWVIERLCDRHIQVFITSMEEEGLNIGTYGVEWRFFQLSEGKITTAG